MSQNDPLLSFQCNTCGFAASSDQQIIEHKCQDEIALSLEKICKEEIVSELTHSLDEPQTDSSKMLLKEYEIGEGLKFKITEESDGIDVKPDVSSPDQKDIKPDVSSLLDGLSKSSQETYTTEVERHITIKEEPVERWDDQDTFDKTEIEIFETDSVQSNIDCKESSLNKDNSNSGSTNSIVDLRNSRLVKFIDPNSPIDNIDVISTTKFKWKWLLDQDSNDDVFSSYVRKIEKDGVAWCCYCNTEVKYGSRGFRSLKDHAKSRRHRTNRCIHKSVGPREAIQATDSNINGTLCSSSSSRVGLQNSSVGVKESCLDLNKQSPVEGIARQSHSDSKKSRSGSKRPRLSTKQSAMDKKEYGLDNNDVSSLNSKEIGSSTITANFEESKEQNNQFLIVESYSSLRVFLQAKKGMGGKQRRSKGSASQEEAPPANDEDVGSQLSENSENKATRRSSRKRKVQSYCEDEYRLSDSNDGDQKDYDNLEESGGGDRLFDGYDVAQKESEESDDEYRVGSNDETENSDDSDSFDESSLVEPRPQKITSVHSKAVFACWICFRRFLQCRGLKQHISRLHRRALCAFAVNEGDDPYSQLFLVLFCPNILCSFSTSEWEPLSQHIATSKKKCGDVKMAPDQGQDLGKGEKNMHPTHEEEESDNEESKHFLSIEEYKELREEFESGKIIQLMKEQNCFFLSQAEADHSNKQNRSDEPVSDMEEDGECKSTFEDGANRDANDPDAPGGSDIKGCAPIKLYKCNVCPKEFKRIADLHRHLALHSRDRMSACVDCGQSFRDKKCFHEHRGVPKTCVCGKNFCVRNHIRVYPKGSKRYIQQRPHDWKCELCGRLFSKKSYLRNHAKVHREDRPFKCEDCGRAYKDKHSLTQHCRKHTGVRPYMCDKCPKSYTVKASLEDHMRTHTGDKPFLCNECGVSVASMASLRFHMQSHQTERPFKCDLCDTAFFRKWDLRVHGMRKHNKERRFKCEVCGLGCCTAFTYKLHMKIHTGDKAHKCSICGRGFVRKSGRDLHMKRHLGEKPHACEDCGMKFVRKQELNVHMRKHNKEKNYENKKKSTDRDISNNGNSKTFDGKNSSGDDMSSNSKTFD